MTTQRPSGSFPFRLQSPSGLSVELNSNGAIRRIDYQNILINLFLGTELDGGPANLFLRRGSAPIEAVALLGPGSPAAFSFIGGRVAASGQWGAIRFYLSLVLSASTPAFFWRVWLENTGAQVETLDLVYLQDLGLAEYDIVRTNEFYASQYVDHTALDHPQKGRLVASRQNLPMAGRNPWIMIGALGRAVGYCTDALQFYGKALRDGRTPRGLFSELPNARLQHEHSMAGIQDEPVRLQPGGTVERGFFGWFEPDHPGASGEADIAFADMAASLPEAAPAKGRKTDLGKKPAATLFSANPPLETLELTPAEIGQFFGNKRQEEEWADGQLLSFFSGPERHVVLRAKEAAVLRPHAHIIRTGDSLVPEEASLTSTMWMGGVFHSMVTQGHVSINRFLSSTHSYLGLFRANGARIFIETEKEWRLLDAPSAFEMSPRGGRWLYKHPGGLLEIGSEAMIDRHELTLSAHIHSGPPARLLFSFHVAMGGDDGAAAVPVEYAWEEGELFVAPPAGSEIWRRFLGGGFYIAPFAAETVERTGRDELLFTDGLSRSQPYLCIIAKAADFAGFKLKGRLIRESEDADAPRPGHTPKLRIHPPSDSAEAGLAARFEQIFPWFVHNALIHYLAPRGIEQYTGGGWGTRDICQGPVEMLLAFGRRSPVRDLLLRVFSAQNPDGDWPQWFNFFDRERNIRAADSHGDVVFWPLLALSQYLLDSEDRTLLEETAPFHHPGPGHGRCAAAIRRHVERALEVIRRRIVPGTRLTAYGRGDWNDSLQPLDPSMRDRLCSSWTVALHIQTLEALAEAFKLAGETSRAAELESEAAGIKEDFRKFLLVDGVLTGFASFDADGVSQYFLHPRDRVTGLSYRLLPMIHAIINDLLTPEEARSHIETISAHLLGPDGARLFDRPMEYRGGPMRFFQRAESAAFFGREIGLMYTHAHLRYAEALARLGDATGFLVALAQANPAGIRKIVPSAALRQANCYYSSSDAAFSDRYHARAEYARVKTGEVPFEGGWRIYSSGAGIWTKLLLQCFLGLRMQKSTLTIDPVVPRSLDGLRVDTELEGSEVEVIYRVRKAGFGPETVALNGRRLDFVRTANPYRTGGAKISTELLRENLSGGKNSLAVELG